MSLEAIRTTQEARLQLYEDQVDAATWKQAHNEAMECLAFEGTLSFGIAIFDYIVRIDEKLRPDFLRGKIDGEYTRVIRSMIKWWLKPCKAVEAEIRLLEKAGFNVEGAEEFRRRHAEANWMLAPAHKAFDHPKMVELRDQAIEALRREDVVSS